MLNLFGKLSQDSVVGDFPLLAPGGGCHQTEVRPFPQATLFFVLFYFGSWTLEEYCDDQRYQLLWVSLGLLGFYYCLIKSIQCTPGKNQGRKNNETNTQLKSSSDSLCPEAPPWSLCHCAIFKIHLSTFFFFSFTEYLLLQLSAGISGSQQSSPKAKFYAEALPGECP